VALSLGTIGSAASIASLALYFKNELKKLASRAKGALTKPSVSLFFVPLQRNNCLRGVEDRLAEIETQLNAQEVLALTGRGGVGKTSLAIELAYRTKKKYRGGAYWIDAVSGLGFGYADLAGRMGERIGKPILDTAPDEAIIRQMVDVLNQPPLKLVIVDDLQDWTEARRGLPVNNCHVLVTTRRANLPPNRLAIAEPRIDQAQEIFLAYAGWEKEQLSSEQAQLVAQTCERVENLPLALEILGRVAALTPLAQLKTELDNVWAARAELHTKEQTSILAALDLAKRYYSHEGAVEALKVAGYLAPGHITAEVVGPALDLPASEAGAALRALSEMSVLVASEGGYTIHRLIQGAAREMDPERTVGERVVEVLDGMIQAVSDKGEYRKAYGLIPHLLHITSMSGRVGEIEAFPSAYALNHWAEYLRHSGFYSPAETLNRSCLAHIGRAKGEEHAEYAIQLNNLALVLQAQSNYDEAEGLYRRALEIGEKTLGKGHPNYAIHLANLSGVLEAQGKYSEAEPTRRKVLAIHKEKLGENHPHYAIGLNNLAGALKDQGKYAEAEGLYRRALEIGEKTIGTEHPEYATRLNNLALALDAQGKYAKAEGLYCQALEIDEKTIGTKHPEYAKHLGNLAGVLWAQDKFAEAERLYRRALEIGEKTIGTEHPDYATDLNNLAGVLGAQGKHAEAEPFLRLAVEIDGKVLGLDHPRYARHLGNLARCLISHGKMAEAEPLLSQAVAVLRERLGPEHPTMIEYAEDLDRLLAKLKK